MKRKEFLSLYQFLAVRVKGEWSFYLNQVNSITVRVRDIVLQLFSMAQFLSVGLVSYSAHEEIPASHTVRAKG